MLAAVGAVTAGCGEDDRSAGPERGVTAEGVEENQPFFEGEYRGRQVTISAAVSEVLGETTLEVNGGTYGENSLLVVTTAPVSATSSASPERSGTSTG